MTELEAQAELKKCQEDVVYFMENYCTVNGEPIKVEGFIKDLLSLHKRDLTDDQIQAIVFGYHMVGRLRRPEVGFKKFRDSLDVLLQKYPVKQDVNFTWKIQKQKDGNSKRSK